MRPNLLTKGVKFYNLLKVNYKRLTDPNFNAFLQFSGNNGLEDINSKEKLKFMRLVDLSKQGYINPERKDFYKKEKQLYKLMEIDQGIKNIGRLSIVGDDGVLTQLYVGINEETKKIFLSDRQVNQVPIWTKPSVNMIEDVFSTVFPKTGESGNQAQKFEFKNEFFNYDVESLPTALRNNLEVQFDKLAEIAFKSNKYLVDNIPSLPDDLMKTPNDFLDMNFKVPASFFPELDQNHGFIVASFQAKDHNGYIFKPAVSGRERILKVSSEVLEDRLNDRKIMLVGKLNDKISIGINRSNGNPQIGIKMP
ncbi:MAG: hypothetical protein AAGH46_13100, partial [Bacteroidota bacterium]